MRNFEKPVTLMGILAETIPQIKQMMKVKWKPTREIWRNPLMRVKVLPKEIKNLHRKMRNLRRKVRNQQVKLITPTLKLTNHPKIVTERTPLIQLMKISLKILILTQKVPGGDPTQAYY